ncbi:BnaCnng31100D [Brassica napus]|uniref:BnaCnng31100D protein n=2 Tax=Brassica napus TaxID=3708 RepID=A0A078IXQ2_BRANA|nr:BnaCnng31100D [Brassica napus]
MWWDAGSYGPFPILNDGLGLCSCGSYFHFHLGFGVVMF